MYTHKLKNSLTADFNDTLKFSFLQYIEAKYKVSYIQGSHKNFRKKNLGKKNKNLGKNYQKFLSKIKEICIISLILF